MKVFNLNLIYLLIIILIHTSANAQQLKVDNLSDFQTYIAQYEEAAGTTIVNMSLKKIAPISDFPFVLITGVTFKDCKDGFPTESEFPRLYVISDSIRAQVNALVKNYEAGTFTYQCQRLDYYYITDTTHIRDQLLSIYKQRFSSYEPYINIKVDKEWKGYLEFLYPNAEILKFMADQQVIMGLMKAGDNLEKARRVDHWIYFKNKNDKELFISYAIKNGFSIEKNGRNKADAEGKFGLQIFRTDKVDPNSIMQITTELKKEAQKFDGEYDGWETEVVK